MAEAVLTQAMILKATAGTLTFTFYDDDGVAAAPGTVTLGVTDEAGTVIVASGTVTVVAGNTRTFAYTTTHTANLNRWVITLASSVFGTLTCRVEVVGAFLFGIAEMRTAVQSPLGSTSVYPATALEQARAFVLDDFTRILGYAPVPRFTYLSADTALDGMGTAFLTLPHFYVRSVRSVESREYGTDDWTAFTVAELADTYITDGGLYRESLGTWLSGTRNYRVGYEHGLTTIPHDLKRAALVAGIHEAQQKNASSRAISTTSEFGTEQLWTPGISGRGQAVHELPFVDRVLRAARLERIVVG